MATFIDALRLGQNSGFIQLDTQLYAPSTNFHGMYLIPFDTLLENSLSDRLLKYSIRGHWPEQGRLLLGLHRCRYNHQ